MVGDTRPLVTVLLATFNGLPWLPEQVQTILDQQDVQVEVIVSDDGSTDGTWEWLQELATHEPRLHLVERSEPSGSAAKNFYRLLREVDLADCELIAFADQDDRWLPGKLAAQVALLRQRGSDGTSCDVTAFDAAGRRTLIRKSFPQRRWDFLFESPGPGCTFLITARLASQVQALVRDPASRAGAANYHDCLIYAVARAAGWGWTIDDKAWVDYRQHESNVLGANSGYRAALDRLRPAELSRHRADAGTLVEVCLEVTPAADRAELLVMRSLLTVRTISARLRLVAHAGQLRRRPRDRWILGALVAAGLW